MPPNEMPQVRGELLPLLTQIWNQSSGADDLFTELSRTLMGARQEAETAKTALETGRRTIPDSVNPIAESLARAFGNAASLFTGTEHGRESARATVSQENALIQQKRKESLATLEGAYERAAARAEKLGDFETQMKFLTKRDATIKKQEDINKVLMGSAEADIADKRQQDEFKFRKEQGEREFQQLEQKLQTEFGQNLVLTDMKIKASQREAFIQQGLDPDDPSKPLTSSKAFRIHQAPALGFLNTNQWTGRYASLLNATAAGKPAFQKDKLRGRFLSELAPDAAYVTNPEGWLNVLMTLPNPNKKDEYLFPRDPRNPAVIAPAYLKRVKEYMMRYYPDWNPAVSAVDSVGR